MDCYIADGISNIVSAHIHHQKIKVIIDKFISNKNRRQEFNSQILHKIAMCSGVSKPKIEIDHISSFSCPGLQAADFIAGAAFSKYERGCEDYYEIIKSKD